MIIGIITGIIIGIAIMKTQNKEARTNRKGRSK